MIAAGLLRLLSEAVETGEGGERLWLRLRQYVDGAETLEVVLAQLLDAGAEIEELARYRLKRLVEADELMLGRPALPRWRFLKVGTGVGTARAFPALVARLTRATMRIRPGESPDMRLAGIEPATSRSGGARSIP